MGAKCKNLLHDHTTKNFLVKTSLVRRNVVSRLGHIQMGPVSIHGSLIGSADNVIHSTKPGSQREREGEEEGDEGGGTDETKSGVTQLLPFHAHSSLPGNIHTGITREKR